MNLLFNTRKVIWENGAYNEVPDDIDDDFGNQDDENEEVEDDE
jgi:hypothetical protein